MKCMGFATVVLVLAIGSQLVPYRWHCCIPLLRTSE